MSLKVEENGHIVVVNVTGNGAADRASDLHGNRCPIKSLDCIVEINGVSLHVRILTPVVFFCYNKTDSIFN